MSKTTQTKTPLDERKAVYLRLDRELVAWTDKEAKRQRRSRAYVISEAIRVLRVVIAEMESERSF